MSTKECEIIDRISSLPPRLQDKFLNMAQGAAMAMDAMEKPTGGEKTETEEV